MQAAASKIPIGADICLNHRNVSAITTTSPPTSELITTKLLAGEPVELLVLETCAPPFLWKASTLSPGPRSELSVDDVVEVDSREGGLCRPLSRSPNPRPKAFFATVEPSRIDGGNSTEFLPLNHRLAINTWETEISRSAGPALVWGSSV